jgi:hypothetical protein
MFADTTGGRRGLGEVRSSFGFAGMPVTVEVPALPPGTVVYDRVTKAAPGVLVLSHPGRHAYRFTADKLSVGDTAEAWATLRQELRGWKIPPTAAEVGEIRHLCKGEHALEQYRDLYRALFPGSYP